MSSDPGGAGPSECSWSDFSFIQVVLITSAAKTRRALGLTSLPASDTLNRWHAVFGLPAERFNPGQCRDRGCRARAETRPARRTAILALNGSGSRIRLAQRTAPSGRDGRRAGVPYRSCARSTHGIIRTRQVRRIITRIW